MNALAEEKVKYEEVYNNIPTYNDKSPADRLYPLILSCAEKLKCKKLLDAGCGSGKIISKFLTAGYDIKGVDITLLGLLDDGIKEHCTETPLSSLPFSDDSFDLAICVDVLEHIPKTDNLLQDSLKELSRTSKYSLFNIALFKDGHGKLIGKTLHETLMPANKWVALLNKYYDQVHVLEQSGIYLTVLCENNG
jgi:SAM-dependent methyltransferase